MFKRLLALFFGPRSKSAAFVPSVQAAVLPPPPRVFSDEELLKLVPVVVDYMHYDILFTKGECRFGDRDRDSKRYGVRVNSKLILKMHSDDMDFTKYAVYAGETIILTMTARETLTIGIPGTIDYESIALPNHGRMSMETLDGIRGLPTQVRRVVNDVFVRFTQTAEFKRDGVNPAVEALLRY